MQGAGGGASYRPTLQFGRRDLEKGRAPATRALLAIGVDPRFDYLADVCLEDLAPSSAPGLSAQKSEAAIHPDR
jgi:hypothetical protein